ncbi:MAG: alpha/beta hydrolase [Lachnospiraceae bacterium]|nr:alpha/beta hydrolase [Lachnospiraceae bacterium]
MNITQKIEKGSTARAIQMAERFVREDRMTEKDGLHLRLAAEEMGELITNLSGDRTGKLSIEDDESGCVVKLRLMRDDAAGSYTENSSSFGVISRVSGILSLNYEAIEAREEELEDIGVRKALKKDFEEMGLKSQGPAYVWTKEAYSNLSFDKLNEDDNESWVEIGNSIIANLSDDIRIFVFEDYSELVVHLSFERPEKKQKGRYAIDPELEELYKIPVAKSRFQVKMVQLLYGRLVDKQRSTDSLKVTKIKIPCSCAPKGYVSVLKYIPAVNDNTETAPAVLFMHGGAFMLPALPYHYRLAEAVALRTGCTVFFTLQHLGPKYALPLPIREAYEVYGYLLQNGKDLKIDTGRIVAMGDSSGGTMTAALSLLAREHGITPPAGQVLLYPSIGLDHETQSMKDYRDVPVVNSEAIEAYHRMLRSDKDAAEFFVHPASAASLENLPPAYVETAEFDALRDEGIEYAGLLEKNGCDVTLNRTKGTVHAFDMAKDSRVLAEAMDQRMAFINRVINREDLRSQKIP